MRTRSTIKACVAAGGGAVMMLGMGAASSPVMTSSSALSTTASTTTITSSMASSSWSASGASCMHHHLSTAIRMASSKATVAPKKKKGVVAATTTKKGSSTKPVVAKKGGAKKAAPTTVVADPSPTVVTSNFGSLSSTDILEIDHIRGFFIDPLTDVSKLEAIIATLPATATHQDRLTALTTAMVVPLSYELAVPVSLGVLLEALAAPLKVALEMLVDTAPTNDSTAVACVASWKATLKAAVSTQNGKDVLSATTISKDMLAFMQQQEGGSTSTAGSVRTLGGGAPHPVLMVTLPKEGGSGEGNGDSLPPPPSYVLPASYEFFLRRVYPGIRDDASRSLSHIMRIAGWHGFGLDRVVQEQASEQCVIVDDDEFGGEVGQIGGGMLLGDNNYDAVKREYNYECSQQESAVYMAYLCHLQGLVSATNQSLKLLVSFDSPDEAAAAQHSKATLVDPSSNMDTGVAASGSNTGACITGSERLSTDRIFDTTNNAHDVFLQRQTTTDQRFASVNELIRLLGHNSRRATSKKQYMQFHRTAVKEEGVIRKEVDAIEAISHRDLYQEVVMREAVRIQSRGLPSAIRYLKLERGILATLDPYLQQYNNQGHKSDRVEGPGASAPSTDYSVLEKPAAEKKFPASTPDVSFLSPRTLAEGPRSPPTSAELISCASRVSSPQFLHDIMAGCPSKRTADGTPLPAWCFPFYAGYFLAGDDLQGIADKHVARAIKFVLMYDKAEDERETLRNACREIKKDLVRQYPYIPHLHGLILAATFRFFRSHEQLHRALKKSVDAADDEEVKKSRIKEIMMGNLRNSLTELEFVIDATMTHIETASHIPGRRTSVKDPEDVKREKADKLFQYWYVDWLSRVATTKT